MKIHPRRLAYWSGTVAGVLALPVVAATPPLSPQIPFDVTVVPPVSLQSLQHDFDVLSWQTFVAVNWPALANGQADTGAQIGKPDAATVWESWKESYQIFLPNGQKPAGWNQPSPPPAACQGLKSGRVLQQMGKVPDVLDETIQPFKTGPLVDQSGRYTRNEIVLNQSMFDGIVDNGLYSIEGQQAFFTNVKNQVAFSCGSNQAKQVGSIMIKASWKLLDGDDQPQDFHTVDALVYTPGNSDPDKGPIIPESCTSAKVGLIGLHIVHKTADAPQWVWSTFEHVRNVPEKTTPVNERKGPYLFYDPHADNRPVNEPPPRPWNPAVKSTPSQIVREIPIDAATQQLNAQFQSALAGTVWANYQLVSTQWPTDPADNCQSPSPTNPLGTPAPNFLANTTLETYIQGTTPQASSSCMECHNNATTKVTQSPRTSFADFTYLLERAQSTSVKE
ncbi:cytochrome C [Pseudomonas sp. CR3202]|uniref:cytochrome C n=1 Tax=Pseudomonas sp. CR3202 TaxID=3351532 RepID=UPI003BF2BD18